MTKFSPKRVVVCLSLVTLALVLPATLFSRESLSTRAEAWVSAHRERLPIAWREYVSFPVVYQRAIWRASTAEVKSGLMKERLALSLKVPGLTADQLHLIDRAMAAATPGLYRDDPDAKRVFAAICAESKDVLPGDMADLLLPVAPPALGFDISWEALSVRVREGARRLVLLHAAGPCDCGVGVYCSRCGFWVQQECVPGVQNGFCELVADECGCGWASDCDGFCWTPPGA